MKKLKFSPLQNRQKRQKTVIKTILSIMQIRHKMAWKILFIPIELVKTTPKGKRYVTWMGKIPIKEKNGPLSCGIA